MKRMNRDEFWRRKFIGLSIQIKELEIRLPFGEDISEYDKQPYNSQLASIRSFISLGKYQAELGLLDKKYVVPFAMLEERLAQLSTRLDSTVEVAA